MGIVTDRKAPADVPTTNALDQIDDDLLEIPPAILGFGSTKGPLSNPPAEGERRTYIVRVECTGEHGPLQRAKGTVYKRDLSILWCVEHAEGKPLPPDPDDEQGALLPEEDEDPSLIGRDGQIAEDESKSENGSGGVDFSDKS